MPRPGAKKKDPHGQRVLTPWLDQLDEALSLSWEGARAAGRVQRHVEILRDVARHLDSDPARPERPSNAAEAETQFWDFLTSLQRRTPRVGLSAPTAAFVDHLVALSGRWGAHLFTCFDDPNLPPTTNQLEGTFGQFKRMLRRVVGAISTSSSLATNLGAELLLAWHQVRCGRAPMLAVPIDPQAHRTARADIALMEQPARERRSWVRSLSRRLSGLLSRWLAQLPQLRVPGQFFGGDLGPR